MGSAENMSGLRRDRSAAGRLDALTWNGPRGRLHIVSEIVYVSVFYGLYTLIRNTQGSARNSHTQAFTNAKRVLHWEQWLGIAREASIQQSLLAHRFLLQALNTYYGTAHFIVTIVALVWCFKARALRYRSIRNALAVMTGAALIGFAFFPLMPPRLLPSSYGFVDSLKVFGGPWSFDSGAMAKVSNQYAAMPSLHIGWSTWCTYTLWDWSKRRSVRIALVAYPLLTLFCIVATANHYVLDAGGGLAVFTVGVALGHVLDRSALVDRVRLRNTADARAAASSASTTTDSDG
jgi:hypothetical protein